MGFSICLPRVNQTPQCRPLNQTELKRQIMTGEHEKNKEQGSRDNRDALRADHKATLWLCPSSTEPVILKIVFYHHFHSKDLICWTLRFSPGWPSHKRPFTVLTPTSDSYTKVKCLLYALYTRCVIEIIILKVRSQRCCHSLDPWCVTQTSDPHCSFFLLFISSYLWVPAR